MQHDAGFCHFPPDVPEVNVREEHAVGKICRHDEEERRRKEEASQEELSVLSAQLMYAPQLGAIGAQ